MVLTVLVIVLCYRVYGVVNPPPIEAAPNFPPPGNAAPDGVPAPPPVPLPTGSPDTGQIVARNPFSVYGGAPAQVEQEPQLDIELVRTMPLGPNEARAQIVVNRQRRWVSQGEEFDGYRVERIDPETNEVVIWSQEDARSYTLGVGQ